MMFPMPYPMFAWVAACLMLAVRADGLWDVTAIALVLVAGSHYALPVGPYLDCLQKELDRVLDLMEDSDV